MEKRIKAFTGAYLDDLVDEANMFLKQTEGNLHDATFDADSLGDFTIMLIYTPKQRDIYEKSEC